MWKIVCTVLFLGAETLGDYAVTVRDRDFSISKLPG